MTGRMGLCSKPSSRTGTKENFLNCFLGSQGSGKIQHCQVVQFTVSISHLVIFQIKDERQALTGPKRALDPCEEGRSVGKRR